MRSILEFCRREENLTKSLVLKGSRGATKRASGLSSVPEFWKSFGKVCQQMLLKKWNSQRMKKKGALIN